MPLSAQENFRRSDHQHVSQLSPIFLIAIDEQGYFWIFADVSQTFEPSRRALFGLFIDRRKDLLAIKHKANGDDMRLAGAIHRRQMGDAGGANESDDFST